MRGKQVWLSLALVGTGALLGYLVGAGQTERVAWSQPPTGPQLNATNTSAKRYASAPSAPEYFRQSPGAVVPTDPNQDYGLGDGHISKLKPYPKPMGPGIRTPFDLHRYGGKGPSSYGSPTLSMTWDEWFKHCSQQKPKLMEECAAYMNTRYDFHGRPMLGAMMSGGRKPVPAGPVARLPSEVDSWEHLAALAPSEIKQRDLFPFKPLAHPLQSTAHMLFPQAWVEAHPEHERIDCDFDIPDPYLPEFPPPMFLTTHKELGDVSGGREITFGNYFEIFNGLLTPEQMEGLKELLRPTATTWFNQTEHRVTKDPSAGVACFSCHVNGHTNGAIELAPDSRPNLARLRTDTPSMRGNFNFLQLSRKRSIRTMDHFAEVEEYFDGDPGLQQALGGRAKQRQVTNRMGDFNAILDFPPAPKLLPTMELDRRLASEHELRGERLFHGKAQCYKCHSGPAFTDDYLHDLRVERFYTGRPEGAIKTFALRGIKDSPPYLHDGRCPTLHDAVEFFNIVLELDLTQQEKDDLVAYMLCL